MSETSSPKRPRLDYDDGKDDHYDKFNKGRDQDDQSFVKSKRKRDDIDEDDGKDEDKSKTVIETARREHTLVMRLTNKEQELQECMNQIQEMKQAQTQNTAQLRSMLLDPAINLVFQRMAKEMEEHKEKLKQKQNELNAWKFTPDSQTGMRLMAKCRMLLQENGDLGKMISSGRTAKLEGEIALHKSLVTEMKQNQIELDEFVGELEEDVEGMQGMILMLRQQLKDAKEQIARLSHENEQLRTLSMPPDPEPGGDLPEHSCNPKPVSDSRSSTALSSNNLDSSGDKSCPLASSSLRTSNHREQTSSEEEVNGGFLCFKATPDSGMYTLEEDASVDNTEYLGHSASQKSVSQNRTFQEGGQDPSEKNVTSSSSSSNIISKQSSVNPSLSENSIAQTADSTANIHSNSNLSNGCKHLSGNLSDSVSDGRTCEDKIDGKVPNNKTEERTLDSEMTGKINEVSSDNKIKIDKRTNRDQIEENIGTEVVEEKLVERTGNLQDGDKYEKKSGNVSESMTKLTLVNGSLE